MRAHSMRILSAAAVLAVVATLGAPRATAGVDVSFGASVPIGDDGNLFFSISSRYFDREPAVVHTWARRYANPDDLAVSLWIAQRSGRTPDFIFSLRHRGLSWFDVGTRCGIPVDAWYVAVPADRIGPPYGRAYGYRDKHHRNPHYRVRLSDADARNLVAVRMAHEYYGVSPETAMEWRRGGESLRVIMTREYRTRHGRVERRKAVERREAEHDRGHGHGEHDRGHGHGHD